ncbi:MAG TPA: DUF4007 family protein [Ignavibacteriaceae bacterium]
MKLQFSGHETFICKHFWLKKGYDFINQSRNFNDESAVVDLGVGKNMVASISYWLKAFGICESDNQITKLGHYIFHDRTGKDPYIESIGTLWLLQYNLIKTNKASIYSLFFNFFKKGKTEFSKEQFSKFLIKHAEQEIKVNTNTINSDIAVFIRNYLASQSKNSKLDVEEEFSNLLTDLELLKTYQVENIDGKTSEWYKAENGLQVDLPSEIVLYTILDNLNYSKSISFRDLLNGFNSPGAVFSLNEEGLYQKLEDITSQHKNIIYKETAGIKELQIKGQINKEEILNGYYKA